MLEKVITRNTRSLLESYKKDGSLWYWKVSDRFTSGIPDFVGVYYGRFFAIELKADDKKASVIQSFMLRKIQKAGGITLSTDNFEEVECFLFSLSQF